MEIALAILLVLIAIICWVTNLVGIPGNWLMLVAVILFALFAPVQTPITIGWPTVLVLAALAGIGELMEFSAGAVGVSSQGGSKRGAVLAMLGSVGGGIAGIFIGSLIPIPVLGQVVGALFFACLGALVGAMIGETWKGKELKASFDVGVGAFIGRLLGTLSKILTGAFMLVALTAGLFL